MSRPQPPPQPFEEKIIIDKMRGFIEGKIINLSVEQLIIEDTVKFKTQYKNEIRADMESQIITAMKMLKALMNRKNLPDVPRYNAQELKDMRITEG